MVVQRRRSSAARALRPTGSVGGRKRFIRLDPVVNVRYPYRNEWSEIACRCGILASL